MKKILYCYLQTILDLLETGVYNRHLFRDEFEPSIIVYDDKSFYPSNSYEHNANQQICKDGILIKSKCIYCGKEELSWCKKDFYEKYLKER